MTTVVIDQPETPARKPWGRRRGELGDHVARVIDTLQARLLRDTPDPAAVSALARLRRGIGRSPGFDYTLEHYLYVPEHLLGYRSANDAEPTDAEHAVHDAVTLYALHQQSRRAPMHGEGRGLGTAMATLVRMSHSPDGVRRRFAALGTASTYPESIYHLRSLITMLREQEIGLDYGLLADDLQTLRRPWGRPQMQAAWGREFFRSRPAAQDGNLTDTTDDPEEKAL